MRKTHSTLYWLYITYALTSAAQGVNFLLSNPTFMQLDVPKNPLGLAFLACGLPLLTLLLLNKTWGLQVWMGLNLFMYSWWAAVLTYDFIDLNRTSMQLPICYIALAVFGFRVLLEPFTNPATAIEDET